MKALISFLNALYKKSKLLTYKYVKFTQAFHSGGSFIFRMLPQAVLYINGINKHQILINSSLYTHVYFDNRCDENNMEKRDVVN